MKRYSLFIGGILLLICCGTRLNAQPSLLGIGLSSSITRLDTAITDGGTIYVIASFTAPTDIRMEGVALGSSQLQRVQINFYTELPPAGTAQSFDVVVNPATISIDTTAQPHLIRFSIPLPSVVIPNVASLQMNLAVYGRDTTNRVAISERRSGFIAIGSVLPLNNPVDSLHWEYLQVVDVVTRPPTIFAPQNGSLIGRRFSVQYSQPEDAAPGTLMLTMNNLDTAAGDFHRFYLSDRAAGTFKTLSLNSNALFSAQEMDSSTGSNALRHAAFYSLRLSYQDRRLNPPAVSIVDSVEVDLRTEPPTITDPVAGRAISRRFVVRYNQPETAAPGTVLLVISNVDSNATEDPHFLYLRDRAAGSNKLLSLDALSLFDSTSMDSLVGPLTMSAGSNFELELSYQDFLNNDPASTTTGPVHLDIETEPPLLFEPRAGSSTADSTVRVIYELPELADTVWLSFVEDTISTVPDSQSPHVLRLVPVLNGPGVVNCSLDGRNIGTGGPNVAESNRGSGDALVAQCVYTVTLTYGDVAGNLSRSVSNSGYVWPRDEVTLPPQLLEPVDASAFSSSFRIVFSLPEVPRPGSVYVRIVGGSGVDHGSPHRVFFRNIAPGLNSLTMYATALNEGLSVDSVAGSGTPAQNSTLVDGVAYTFFLAYRDSSNNPEVSQRNSVTATFDGRTDPISFSLPHPGDTLNRTNINVQFYQPERALAASLRMIFERIAGGDDPNRHVLRLHDALEGEKTLDVHPSALSTTPGADTISGGNELVLRAVYRLSMEYQDTLGNERAISYIDSLAYPSGSIVVAGGTSLGAGQVIPGTSRLQAFRLQLRTLGGSSVLRELRFWPDGTMNASDLNYTQVHLWSSVDTILSDTQDQIIANLAGWSGGEMVFRSFTSEVQETETSFFVTLGFFSAANPAHRVRLQLRSSGSIDCSGDPVVATSWPLGQRDVALSVSLTGFNTDQDTTFGALRIWWTVASETDNQGFTLLRRGGEIHDFQPIASWRDQPELIGRGTSPTAVRYQFTDRGLVPGIQYAYRLTAESFTGDAVNFDNEAVGIPRVPPNDFVLGDAYPNPFNQTVMIPYIVPATAKVEITVFNLFGQKVCTLVRGLLVPAEYRARWDGRDGAGIPVTSGLYLIRMQAGAFDKTRKLFLLR